MTDGTPLSLDQVQAYLDDSPFHRLFNMKAEHCSPEDECLAIRMAFTPSVERATGSGQYHGGAIASLIDIAGDFVLIYLLGHGVPTINFRVDYLRPALATDLVARARVRRVGRTVGVVDIDVEDDQSRLIAVGRGCYGIKQG